MSEPRLNNIRSREILDSDIPNVARLLANGLGYPNQYFQRVFNCLKDHQTPTGFPKYGHLLESDGNIVGAILLIFTTIRSAKEAYTRCHVTSWYVEPAYRIYATLFISRVLNYKGVTYLNVSARTDTRPIIAAQGFSQYSNGLFTFVPLMQRVYHDKVIISSALSVPNVAFEPFEREILISHSKAECISFWCITSTRAHPFVFLPYSFKGFIPGAQVIYCSSIDDLVRFAQPIGSFLARSGRFILGVDANGPINGLTGVYFRDVQPRYYKGPQQPRLGDLAYTQAAICGYQRKPRKLSAISARFCALRRIKWPTKPRF